MSWPLFLVPRFFKAAPAWNHSLYVCFALFVLILGATGIFEQFVRPVLVAQSGNPEAMVHDGDFDHFYWSTSKWEAFLLSIGSPGRNAYLFFLVAIDIPYALFFGNLFTSLFQRLTHSTSTWTYISLIGTHVDYIEGVVGLAIILNFDPKSGLISLASKDSVVLLRNILKTLKMFCYVGSALFGLALILKTLILGEPSNQKKAVKSQ